MRASPGVPAGSTFTIEPEKTGWHIFVVPAGNRKPDDLWDLWCDDWADVRAWLDQWGLTDQVLPGSPGDVESDPLAEVAVAAIRVGDAPTLARVLDARPDLAVVSVPGYQGRTMLHIATDWPANFPGVAITVALLVAAGADVNARGPGEHPETPLHWAASSDDVAAVDALLDAGADIDASGAVIGGGTPLNDATAFGQWQAARRLVARGATVSAWDAAAVGLLDQVKAHVQKGTATPLNELFWAACHGGQRDIAAYLLTEGADINWVGYDGLTPLGAAERSEAPELAEWLRRHGATSGD